MSLTIDPGNSLSIEAFVERFGGVYEHSPWIARSTWSAAPFDSLEQLQKAFCQTVADSSPEEKLSLIRAHPDLVGRVVLTAESQGEQQAAGLGDLTPDESALFELYNSDYKARFGFPFVICARKNKKDAILEAFPRRLQNSREQEIQTALEQIHQIASLRLADLLSQPYGQT